jgi:hypothetical protein
MLASELKFKPHQVSPFLWPKNLINHLYVQSVQNLISIVTWVQKSLVTKPCVDIGGMSNRRESEFGIFRIQSFWECHGEISPKTWFVPKGAICPEFLIQPTGRDSDSHISQITNRLEPFNGPSESWESWLPKWYSGLPEFQPIRNPNVKIRSAAVLSRNRIQQWLRSSKFHNF